MAGVGDDDLQPYAMDEEADTIKAKAPVYIRDCIEVWCVQSTAADLLCRTFEPKMMLTKWRVP